MEPDSNFARRLASLRRLADKNAIASHRIAAEKLVEDYPKRALAHLELGIALTELASYDEARKAIELSARLCKPEARYFPFFWKAHLYREQGNLPLAEKWFLRSLELNPSYPETWAFLGACQAKQGKYDAAKSSWYKLIELGTGATEEAYFNLGLILRAEQQYREALEYAKKALALDPKYRDAKRLIKDLEEVLPDDA